MDIRKLKYLSISNLILIILNKDYSDTVRKCAEVELRNRVRHLDIEFDDLVHLDDKVISERGLDIDAYLLSPRVSLQQLIESYFKYCYHKKSNDNGLLFSEKHLCNDCDFGSPFFSKICDKEISRLDKVIGNGTYTDNHDEIVAREMLSIRNKTNQQTKIELLKDDPIELLFYNDAVDQLDDATLEPYYNLGDEEKYKYFKSNFGRFMIDFSVMLSDSILDNDLIQYLYGLHFVKKDAKKLRYQRKLLMDQIRRGYEVNYGSEEIKKILK